MANTLEQRSNAVGFPKAGELIEITGAHELEAQDRAVLNLLYQHAHDSGRLGDISAEWELPLAVLRSSRHESNDRLRAPDPAEGGGAAHRKLYLPRDAFIYPRAVPLRMRGFLSLHALPRNTEPEESAQSHEEETAKTQNG